MPELPEVEATRRGLDPWVRGRRVVEVAVRERRLRWPVPARLERELPGRVLAGTARRAKYLLLPAGAGTVLVHLGMSGSLRRVPADAEAGPHDHVDLVLDDGHALRLRDPRRFGAVLWVTADPALDPRLAHLGPEPLSDAFDGAYLHVVSRGRRARVKSVLMDGRVVVGVGNIYASEALFAAGVHPHRAAGRIGRERFDRLAAAVKDVLAAAIENGGTTLRDYAGVDGRPGGNATRLAVYGRAGEPCLRCRTPIRLTRRDARATYHCPRCQR
ncbi:MAG: bifunctional DNA-formamidopyrimidine glycosylase/DNA-(apurinic or apyrimidinic site) lyase [Planctomycetota bacterium JB042]